LGIELKLFGSAIKIRGELRIEVRSSTPSVAVKVEPARVVPPFLARDFLSVLDLE
jgi:hypothetical protein